MSPPAQSWPFLDPMLPHLYWPWEATHNKPPTCNPSSQSLLPRECDLRHLSATRCQHNSQGKARSLLIYVDPSMIYASSEWKAKSLAIYMQLHPLRNSVSSTTPATLAVPETQYICFCLRTSALTVLYSWHALCRIINQPPSLTSFSSLRLKCHPLS